MGSTSVGSTSTSAADVQPTSSRRGTALPARDAHLSSCGQRGTGGAIRRSGSRGNWVNREYHVRSVLSRCLLADVRLTP